MDPKSTNTSETSSDPSSVISAKLFDTNIEQADMENECRSLSKDITEKCISMAVLITELRNLLVSETVEERVQGTRILAEVLFHIPTDYLNEQEVAVISAFFNDRLKDNHKVLPAVLRGIHSITLQKNVPKNVAREILQTTFQNVACQQLTQTDRFVEFKILKEFLERCPEEMNQMGADYVYGVLTAIDGERDPRNLLFLFTWLPYFFNRVNLGHLADDAFDVVGCYFPVDFQSTSEQEKGITRQSLADALLPCLCAVPTFAELSITLALEKLQSSLRLAILDSLNLLRMGCSKFSAPNYEPHLKDIWLFLKQNAMVARDPEIVDSALTTLTEILKLLATNPATQNTTLQSILVNIENATKGSLQVTTSLFKPTMKILMAVSRADKITCEFIVKHCSPALINQYFILEEVEQQVLILDTLISFAIIYVSLFETLNGSTNLYDVPKFCVSGTVNKEPSIRSSSLTGLKYLMHYLGTDRRKEFLDILMHSIINETNVDVREQLLSCVHTYAITYPKEILPLIMKEELFTESSIDKLARFLEAMATLAHVPTLGEEIIPVLQTHCFVLNTSVRNSYLVCYKHIVNTRDEYTNDCLKKCESIKNFVHQCVDFFENGNEMDEMSFYNSAFITRSLMAVYENDNSMVDTQVENVLKSYEKSNNSLYVMLIMLLDGLLTGVRRTWLAQFDKFRLVDYLVCIVLNKKNQLCLPAGPRLIANIINKWQSEEELKVCLANLEQQINVKLGEENTPSIEAVTSLIAWVTKGLLMRGFHQSVEWVAKMVNILDIHKTMANGFGVVMKENCDSLNVENDCNFKILYKQKFFHICNTTLLKKKCTNKPQYLVAMTQLLTEASMPLLCLNFSQIHAQVVECLNSQDTCILQKILAKLSTMFCTPPLLTEYIDDFLPNLLSLAKFKDSMVVRMEAICCLKYICKYPLHKILPFKQRVVYGLIPCLDDKKRLVRQVAVEARCAWILLGDSS